MTESVAPREKTPDPVGNAKQASMDSQECSEHTLLINTLKESLEMHKQIVERIQAEKETVEEELREQKLQAGNQVEQLAQLTKERDHVVRNCGRIQAELDMKTQAYSRIEANFFEHMRAIRAVDADNSTIQASANRLQGKITNLCLSLQRYVDRSKATAYVFGRWPEQKQHEKNFFGASKDGEKELSVASCALFAEKLIMDEVVDRVLLQPVRLGVSINDSFQEVLAWMEPKNQAWAGRIRQQMAALVVKLKDGDVEQKKIEAARDNLIEDLIKLLYNIYSTTDDKKQEELKDKLEKKVPEIIGCALMLDLEMKSQDTPVVIKAFNEGKDVFDDEKMKVAGTAPWKEDGTVRLVIIPSFLVPHDEGDETIITKAKVLCS